VSVVVEPAKETDIDAIDEIEQHSFKSPWPRDTFKAELLREWARLDVARIEDRLVGFCNYWLVTTELHILAIATHPDYRGRGIARRLLDHVLDVARTTGCSLASLEVRRSNVPAIALYERAGFKTVHVRTRYYQDDDEDALVMLKALTD
jgi:[ribosomal protein S18]-alanine N-acetyltransferase